MSSKQNQIIKHIEQLSVGTVISIRTLAKDMGVSNGTAYKAIKSAESQGLVLTKNKKGTVRVSSLNRSYTLSELISKYDLKLLLDNGFGDQKIARIIPAMGSTEQLISAIGDMREGCVCICGDREDIMRCAIGAGTNIILTDGTLPSSELISFARSNGRFVLSTEMAGHALCAAIFRSDRLYTEEDAKDVVGNWMSPPVYLYQNDYISDWYRMYQRGDINCYLQPVVNDDLIICGYLPIDKALSSQISWNVQQIYEKKPYPCVVSETDSMQKAMEKLLVSKNNCACVEEEGKLIGLLTPNDFMRFFLYNRNIQGKLFKYSNLLDKIDASEDGRHMTFMLHLPETLQEEDKSSFIILPCMLSAAKTHFAHCFGEKSVFENGVFYSEEEKRFGYEVLIDCDIKKKNKTNCIIEVEMYDDIARFAVGTFMLNTDFETNRED